MAGKNDANNWRISELPEAQLKEFGANWVTMTPMEAHDKAFPQHKDDPHGTKQNRLPKLLDNPIVNQGVVDFVNSSRENYNIFLPTLDAMAKLGVNTIARVLEGKREAAFAFLLGQSVQRFKEMPYECQGFIKSVKCEWKDKEKSDLLIVGVEFEDRIKSLAVMFQAFKAQKENEEQKDSKVRVVDAVGTVHKKPDVEISDVKPENAPIVKKL